MASVVMNRCLRNVFTGSLVLSACDILVSLVTSAINENLTDDQIRDSNTWNQLSAYEVPNGSGYTTGGTLLGTLTVTEDDTNNWVKFDAADTTWADTTLTNIPGAILRTSAVNAETSQLIGYEEWDELKSTVAGDFVITWNTNGILRGRHI